MRIPTLSARRGSTRRRRSFVPGVEAAERRVVLSTLTAVPHFAAVPHAGTISAKAVSLNQKVVDFLKTKVGQRLGDGECAQVATEALRVAGAKFITVDTKVDPNGTGKDSPASGDYDWGTLVKTVEVKKGKVVDSNPSSKVLPGDVIQFRNVTLSNGSTRSHHTAVVAAVDSQGRVTKVYEQNISASGVKGSDRVVRLRDLDLSKLTGGMYKVYRPEARLGNTGYYEFTLVNNTSKAQTLKSGTSSIALTVANTLGSFKTMWWQGKGRPTLTLNGKSYAIDNYAGYQVIGSASSPTLAKLTA